MRFAAFYSDGRTAARRAVSVLPYAGRLAVYSAEGDLLDEWPYEGLDFAEEVFRGQPIRLTHRARGDAVLTFEGGEILSALERFAGGRFRGGRFGGQRRFRSPLALGLFSVLGLIAVVGGLALALPWLVEPLTFLVPPEWEQAVGERVIGQLAEGHPFCEGEAGIAALRSLTTRLTSGVKSPYPFQVRVSGRPEINAFAAPGGHIVLLRGLIEEARSPEEVAAVLAHEIAHGLERHPMQGLVRAVGVIVVFNALMGDTTAVGEVAARFGQLLLISSYTRKDEVAADRIGIGLLNRAGIRGDGLVAFLGRMGQKGSDAEKVPRLLSTHPADRERIERIASLATGSGGAMSPAEWKALKAVCG